MTDVFVDTNILLRHLLQDHPQQSPRATAFLAQIDAGQITAYLSDFVVFEVGFTLERTYKQNKAVIRDQITDILSSPNVILDGKRGFLRALDLYVVRNISLADAHNAITMEQLGLNSVMSFDRDFERIPGITRIEP